MSSWNQAWAWIREDTQRQASRNRRACYLWAAAGAAYTAIMLPLFMSGTLEWSWYGPAYGTVFYMVAGTYWYVAYEDEQYLKRLEGLHDQRGRQDSQHDHQTI